MSREVYREELRERLTAEEKLADRAAKTLRALSGPDDSYPLVISQPGHRRNRGAHEAGRGGGTPHSSRALSVDCPVVEMRPATSGERTCIERHWQEIQRLKS